MYNIKMNEGAFALIDCLGWKGIWAGKGSIFPSLLITKLTKIEDFVKSELSQGLEVYSALDSVIIDPNLIIDVRFLSDTVIVSARFKKFQNTPSKDTQRAFLIDILSIVVTKVVSLFIENEPNLALRGCIAYGDFLIERNYILGEAVDLAGAGEKVAHGAFIYLHKSAEKYFEPWHLNQMKVGKVPNRRAKQLFQKGNRLVKHKMPVKKPPSLLDCYVVNPLANYKDGKRRKEIIDNFKKTMNKTIKDVKEKKVNTVKFLKTANKVSKEYYKAKASL